MTGGASDHLDTSRGTAVGPPSSGITPTRAPDRLMRSAAARAGCGMLLAVSAALAQSGPTIVGFGPPARLSVTPGDILMLQVVGLKTILLAPVKASGVPLPTVLAGISVIFRRYGINLPGPAVAVSLFSIEQTGICGDDVPECVLTSITIQVPLFSLILVGDGGVDFAISENGVSSKAFRAGGTAVNIHVLTACSGSDGFCGAQVAAVTHADGTLVTAASPAKAGEVVVIYATGLGETNPPVPAGQATPAPAPAARNSFYFEANFSPNARPRRPYGDPNALPFRLRPEFVGLTPGQVGLYQINVRIPDTIPPVPPCGGGSTVPTRFPVSSNLTISVSGDIFHNSLDGAAICVAPPQ